MNDLRNLGRCFSIVLLGVICIFIMSILTLCQEDDSDHQAGTIGLEPMGRECLIYSVDREQIKGGTELRWLAGDPSTSEVRLISDSSDSESDLVKRWRIAKIDNDPDIYTIECLVNGGRQWLAGRTKSGNVFLSDSPETKWQLNKIHDDPCLYRIKIYRTEPEDKRWLFGANDDGSVGVGSNAGYQYSNYNIFNSDTSWEITDKNMKNLEID
jgi:hypothetical protein